MGSCRAGVGRGSAGSLSSVSAKRVAARRPTGLEARLHIVKAVQGSMFSLTDGKGRQKTTTQRHG